MVNWTLGRESVLDPDSRTRTLTRSRQLGFRIALDPRQHIQRDVVFLHQTQSREVVPSLCLEMTTSARLEDLTSSLRQVPFERRPIRPDKEGTGRSQWGRQPVPPQ